MPSNAKVGLRLTMPTNEINDLAILTMLAKYETKITTNELFELVAGKVIAEEDPVNFIRLMNSLREQKLAEVSYNRNSLVYWRITDGGRNKLTSEV